MLLGEGLAEQMQECLRCHSINVIGVRSLVVCTSRRESQSQTSFLGCSRRGMMIVSTGIESHVTEPLVVMVTVGREGVGEWVMGGVWSYSRKAERKRDADSVMALLITGGRKGGTFVEG